jgi:hypothetical protein
MIDLAIAFAWIAISAASAKGLAVYARAVAASEVEAEFPPPTPEGGSKHYSRPTKASAHPPSLHP